MSSRSTHHTQQNPRPLESWRKTSSVEIHRPLPTPFIDRNIPLVQGPQRAECADCGELRLYSTASSHRLSIVESRAVKTANRKLTEAYERLPGTLEDRIAWTVVNVIYLHLRTSQKEYLAASHLVSDKALKSIEEGGPARITSYEALLDDWRHFAAQVSDDKVKNSLYSAIDKVSDYLTWDIRNKVNGFLRKLSYVHGAENFESATGISPSTLTIRLKTDIRGNFFENLCAIRSVITSEFPNQMTSQPSIAELWNHPYMVRYRASWMQEELSQRREQGRNVDESTRLMIALRMLVRCGGYNTNAAVLINEFSLPQRTARALVRDVILERPLIDKILNRLSDEAAIPKEVVQRFLHRYDKVVPTNSIAGITSLFGHEVKQALSARGVSKHMLAVAFGLQRSDKGSRIEDVVNCGLITDTKIPIYAVSCIARETIEQVNEDMRLLREEHRLRPRNKGRVFSIPHFVARRYGLTHEELEDNADDILLRNIYGDDKGFKPDSIEDILRIGTTKMLSIIGRYNACYAPRSLQELAELVPERESRKEDLANRAHTTLARLSAAARGETSVPLSLVRKVLSESPAYFTSDLERDWRLTTAQYFSGLPSPLSRVVRLIISEEGDHAAHLYDRFHEGFEKEGISRSAISGRCKLWIKGQSPHVSTLKQVLRAVGREPESISGRFCLLARHHSDMPTLLHSWRETVGDEGRPTVEALLVLGAELSAARQNQGTFRLADGLNELKRRMAEKNVLQEVFTMHSKPIEALEREIPFSASVSALRAVPGVSAQDLIDWHEFYLLPPRETLLYWAREMGGIGIFERNETHISRVVTERSRAGQPNWQAFEDVLNELAGRSPDYTGSGRRLAHSMRH